jgi:phosphoketolase
MPEMLMPDPLTPDLLDKMHAYWRAANYLSVGSRSHLPLGRAKV